MGIKEKQFEYCNRLTQRFLEVCEHPVVRKGASYKCGVDLGTACVVVAVFDENDEAVAGRYQYADVVRDGMVVDYIGAVDIVSRMKKELEEDLGVEELIPAAAAIPPGTEEIDGGAVKNVVMSSGFELHGLLDESTAANSIVGIENGAIVDIGGGTTGISIFKDGKVIYVADEATGGTHFTLTLAGAKHISFEEAEIYKRDPAHHPEILPILKPVAEKVANIIRKHIDGFDVDVICLVGGTSCLSGIEAIIESSCGVRTVKPANPMFVTPLGIGLNCGG